MEAILSTLLMEAFAWLWIGLGVLSGAVLGMMFRSPTFLGGYDAWPRRMVRLGHIAFFGTGLLVLGMAGTLSRHAFPAGVADIVTAGLVIGAVLMPAICLITARWPKAVPAFVIPVLAIGASVTIAYVHLFTLAAEGGGGR